MKNIMVVVVTCLLPMLVAAKDTESQARQTCTNYFTPNTTGFKRCMDCQRQYYTNTDRCPGQCQMSNGQYNRGCVEACMAPSMRELADCVASISK